MIKNLMIMIVFISLFMGSCFKYRELIEALPDADQYFLAEVKYLMAKEERDVFLSLPSEKDRSEFKIQFWKKRDPDSSTEVNELKEEYYKRMEFTNRRFREGNKEGWTTERGRIYILLGAPDSMINRPISTRSSARSQQSYQYFPHIIWVYGNFPIIFVDRNRDNSYSLDTFTARRLGAINFALGNLKLRTKGLKYFFDFKAGVKKEDNQNFLHLQIPMEKMLFDSNEDTGLYTASFDIFITLLNSKNVKVEKIAKHFNISIDKNNKKKMNSDFYYNFKLKVLPAKYIADIMIKNSNSDYYLRKKVSIKL